MSSDFSECGEALPPREDRPQELARLLAHPFIWRAGHAARTQAWPTGFPALDEGLPGGGWPRSGLIEILSSRFGMGELALLMPALAAVTCRAGARWCAWIAPPLQPFAPALEACGIALERMLIVRGAPHARRSNRKESWTFEQALGSGACDIAFAWARQPPPRQIRRLHLAAQRGGTLGVLFRPSWAAREASPAVLRVTVEPLAGGARVRLLKSQGGARGAIELKWASQAALAGHP